MILSIRIYGPLGFDMWTIVDVYYFNVPWALFCLTMGYVSEVRLVESKSNIPNPTYTRRKKYRPMF